MRTGIRSYRRVLISPQEFKGTLTAREASEALARGVLQARPDWQVDVAPLADGGPGTVEAFVTALGGEPRVVRATDPLGREVDAAFALLDGQSAVVEMAAASGLWLIPRSERDPMRASTQGTGELLRAALDAGATTVLVGAGGSATNDGGAGALTALGVRLLDCDGAPLPPGGAALARLESLDPSGLDPRLRSTSISVATDVRNPLLGPEGATAIYGPQKGATPEGIEILEDALSRFADVVERTCAVRVRDVPGSGAAGGLAFGLAAVLGARIVPGFDEIARALRLDERIARADDVLTGEGRVDAQTGYGKGPFALAQRARATGRPVTCFAGVRTPEARPEVLGFERVIEIAPEGPPSKEESMRRLEQAASAWARSRESAS